MTVAKPAKNYTVEKLIGYVSAGGTVLICTAIRVWVINQKVVERWNRCGLPVLKDVNGSMYMGKGKNYTCIDFCGIVLK